MSCIALSGRIAVKAFGNLLLNKRDFFIFSGKKELKVKRNKKEK